MRTRRTVSEIRNDSPRAYAVRMLREQIRQGFLHPAERLPAEEKLALTLGVCRTTIRAALGELKDQGDVRYLKHRGYFVQSASESSNGLMGRTVALLSNEPGRPQARLFTGEELAVESGIIDSISDSGLNTLSLDSSLLDEKGLSELTANPPCGFLISCRFGAHDMIERLTGRLADRRVPVVVYGDTPESCDRVSSDHEGGAFKLAQLLLKRGCRRILRVWSTPPSIRWTQLHNAGFERAMQEVGVAAIPPVYIDDLPFRSKGDREVFDRRVRHFAGYLVEHFATGNGPDALMVGTDCEVFPLAAACRLFGREPGRDVVIAGYDNYWHAAFEREWEPSCPVASVEKHNHLIGEAMVKLLLDRKGGNLPPETQLRMIEQDVVVVEEPAVDGKEAP